MAREPEVLALVGATGTGKTAVSLALARHLDLEVVCGDSRQLYAELDAATGKPTAAERAVAPHHLFDALGVTDAASAGGYARAAAPVLAGIRRRGRVPLVVGGTGLYLKALYRGLAPVPDIPATIREAVRAALAAHGPERLHAELAEHDPELARRLAPRDGQRVARALEVARATGRPLSAWQREPRDAPFGGVERWHLVELRLPRPALRRRLDGRTRGFFAEGLLEETRALLARGVPRTAPGLSSLGYAEAARHLLDGVPLERALAQAQAATRRYAKRQETWWRHEGPRAALVTLDILEGEAAEAIARRVLASWRERALTGGGPAPTVASQTV